MRLFVAAVIAGIFVGTALAQPDGPTRTFAGQKCRYTLPGGDWRWQNSPPDAIFIAANKLGHTITFRCDRIDEWTSLDRSTAADFERALSRSAGDQLKKRGGHFIIFLNLSCYQFEGVYADGRTVASRLFLANGLAYHIMVVGDREPVEQRGDFEKIMSGFEFTDAPFVTTTQSSRAGDFGCLCVAVGLAAVCFMFLALARAGRRSRPRPAVRPRRPRDADFDEVLPVDRPISPQFGGHTGVRAEPARGPLPKSPSSYAESRSSDEPAWDESELPNGTGECRHCGHRPVAFNAEECPVCAGSNPNPGVVSRFAGRGVWIGAALGASVGVIWGFLTFGGGGPAGAVAGLLLGTLPGLIGGLALGIFAGVLARVAGVR